MPSPPRPPTLAALVRGLAPGSSWEEARSLCRAGRVWVGGRPATEPAWRPPAGAAVELLSAAAARARLVAAAEEGGGGGPSPAPRTPSLVVHADADVVVVRKPPGMLTVPFERADRDTLLALTRVALRRIEAGRGGGGSPTLRAVQRLDKDTSGLVVFARHVAAQRALQGQLARREVTRRYEALAHGAVRDATFESWLVEDRGDGLRGSAQRQPPPAGARHAITHVRALEALRGATRIACELDTGRQHQIRIHLAEAGHPLLGEAVYVRDFRGPLLAAPRPMLHAAALGFRHPNDGREMLFEEPAPDDFAALVERLRRGNLPRGRAV
jgi:23S rRNA pseudouridine1911/1915/1917 synthase